MKNLILRLKSEVISKESNVSFPASKFLFGVQDQKGRVYVNHTNGSQVFVYPANIDELVYCQN